MLKAVEAQGRAREGFLEKVTKVICLKGSSRISQGRKEQAEGKGKFQTEEQPAQRHRGVREAGTGVGSEPPVLGLERGGPITRGIMGLPPRNRSGSSVGTTWMSTCYALGTVPESLTCTLVALRGGRCCYQVS